MVEAPRVGVQLAARAASWSAIEARSRGQRGSTLAEALRAHVQAAGAVRAAEPLLAGRRVEVAAELAHVDRHRAEPLGAVQQERARRSRAARAESTPARSSRTRASRPRGACCRVTALASSANGACGRSTPRRSRGAASGASTPGCSSSLVSISSPGPRSSPPSTLFTPSVVERVSATSPTSQPSSAARRARAAAVVGSHQPLEVRLARAPLARARSAQLRSAASSAGARHGPVGAGVQVGHAVEDGELGAEAGAGSTRRRDPLSSRAVIVERSMHPDWLSNAYLVADEPGGQRRDHRLGRPVRSRCSRRSSATAWRPRTCCSRTTTTTTWRRTTSTRSASASRSSPTRSRPSELMDVDRDDRARRDARGRRAAHPRACTRPGTPPGCSRSASTTRRSSPATRSSRARWAACARPGSTTFEDLKALDHGRADEAAARDDRPPRPHRPDDDRRRVGEQRLHPRLARARPRVRPSTARCEGEGATLVLLAPDYDGGHKAWVRWDESGKDDIVPGSRVVRG